MTIWRRLAQHMVGRNGIPADRPPPATTPEIQQVKIRRDMYSVHEAHRAVDAFTAAMEQAMRGQRRA